MLENIINEMISVFKLRFDSQMYLVLSFRITSMAQMFVARVENMKHLLWIAHCSSRE